MPVKRVKKGWKYGTRGKVYPTKRQALRQQRAAHADRQRRAKK